MKVVVCENVEICRSVCCRDHSLFELSPDQILVSDWKKCGHLLTVVCLKEAIKVR